MHRQQYPQTGQKTLAGPQDENSCENHRRPKAQNQHVKESQEKTQSKVGSRHTAASRRQWQDGGQ